MSAGLTSLLVGLQPLATAALAGIWLGEQVRSAAGNGWDWRSAWLA